jgi:hypothetical protein
MNLQREPLACIKKFDEKREPRGWMQEIIAAKDSLPMILPELVQSGSPQRALMNDALGLLPVHQFPDLPDRNSMRQRFAEKNFQASAAPHPFHGQRFKIDRT